MAVYWHSPLSNITTLKHAAKEHPYDALIGHEPASDPFYKHLPSSWSSNGAFDLFISLLEKLYWPGTSSALERMHLKIEHDTLYPEESEESSSYAHLAKLMTADEIKQVIAAGLAKRLVPHVLLPSNAATVESAQWQHTREAKRFAYLYQDKLPLVYSYPCCGQRIGSRGCWFSFASSSSSAALRAADHEFPIIPYTLFPASIADEIWRKLSTDEYTTAEQVRLRLSQPDTLIEGTAFLDRHKYERMSAEIRTLWYDKVIYQLAVNMIAFKAEMDAAIQADQSTPRLFSNAEYGATEIELRNLLLTYNLPQQGACQTLPPSMESFYTSEWMHVHLAPNYFTVDTRGYVMIGGKRVRMLRTATPESVNQIEVGINRRTLAEYLRNYATLSAFQTDDVEFNRQFSVLDTPESVRLAVNRMLKEIANRGDGDLTVAKNYAKNLLAKIQPVMEYYDAILAVEKAVETLPANILQDIRTQVTEQAQTLTLNWNSKKVSSEILQMEFETIARSIFVLRTSILKFESVAQNTVGPGLPYLKRKIDSAKEKLKQEANKLKALYEKAEREERRRAEEEEAAAQRRREQAAAQKRRAELELQEAERRKAEAVENQRRLEAQRKLAEQRRRQQLEEAERRNAEQVENQRRLEADRKKAAEAAAAAERRRQDEANKRFAWTAAEQNRLNFVGKMQTFFDKPSDETLAKLFKSDVEPLLLAAQGNDRTDALRLAWFLNFLDNKTIRRPLLAEAKQPEVFAAAIFHFIRYLVTESKVHYNEAYAAGYNANVKKPKLTGYQKDKQKRVELPVKKYGTLSSSALNVVPTNFSWQKLSDADAGSCAFDSLFTAVFKNPKTWLQKHIFERTTVRSISKDCDTDALHKAIVDDITFLQTENQQPRACVTRALFYQCLGEAPKGDDPRALFGQLLQFYDLEDRLDLALDNGLDLQQRVIPQDYQPANSQTQMILFEVADATDLLINHAGASNFSIPLAVDNGKFELMCCFVTEGEHWISYTRDLNNGYWWRFDANSKVRRSENIGRNMPDAVKTGLFLGILEDEGDEIRMYGEQPAGYLYVRVAAQEDEVPVAVVDEEGEKEAPPPPPPEAAEEEEGGEEEEAPAAASTSPPPPPPEAAEEEEEEASAASTPPPPPPEAAEEEEDEKEASLDTLLAALRSDNVDAIVAALNTPIWNTRDCDVKAQCFNLVGLLPDAPYFKYLSAIAGEAVQNSSNNDLAARLDQMLLTANDEVKAALVEYIQKK